MKAPARYQTRDTRRRGRRRFAPTARRALAGLALLLLPLAVAALDVSEREVDVFEAVIGHGLSADTSLLILAEQTTGDPAAIAAHSDVSQSVMADFGAPAAALSSWSQRNASRALISRPLTLQVSYQLLADEDFAELFSGSEPEQGWTAFFARYPGAPGLLRLSRVGFDESFKHALIYVEHQCGADCGSGRLVYLTLDAATAWNVVDAALVWITD